MKIGILGFGTVGKGVYELSQGKYEVNAVLDRHQKSNGIYFDNFEDFIEQKMDILIEALPNNEIAFEYDKIALNKGISVVSSNKAIIAKHYIELLDLAKKNHVSFSYEAAVCGGIPILHNLLNMKHQDHITSIEGIMNGTSNFILDSIFSNHQSFETALKEAIELGYAEQDYSSDIDGDDVKYKIFLSSIVAYNKLFHLDSIPHYGIRYLNDEIIDYCNKNNKVIKLIGHSDNYNCFVLPFIIDKNHLLGSIHLNNNCVFVNNEKTGAYSFTGQGAGRYPTASSMILDLNEPMKDIEVKLETDSLNNKEYKYLIYKGNIKEEDISQRLSKNLIITKKLPVSKLKEIVDKECFVGGFYD